MGLTPFRPNIALYLNSLLQDRNMRDILGTAQMLFTGKNGFQMKNRDLQAIPRKFERTPKFCCKAFCSINPGKKIDKGIIFERRNRWCQHDSALTGNDSRKLYKLPLWKVNPNIGINGRRWNALQNRGGHSRYLKPYAILLERSNKPCEWRKFS